jgi:hypothetical protein
VHSGHLVPKNDPLIQEAYDDFIMSRKAALLSEATIVFYEYTVGGFVKNVGLTNPDKSTHG